MRSLLIVAADDDAAVLQARDSAADVVVLDLGGLAPDRLSRAREGARAAIAMLKGAGKLVHARLNQLDAGLTRDDLAAVVGPGLDGLALPNTEAPAQIRELDVLIREQEMHNQVRPGTAVLIPEIASARGLLHCQDIVMASTRIAGLTLGGDGYAVSLGMMRSSEGRELDYARGLIVTCCAAYRLMPLDGVNAAAVDGAGLLQEAKTALALGFKGKHVIRPEQVEVINRVFGAGQEA
jgi:citrate lyase subunit beta/citryl-CoA lyase